MPDYSKCIIYTIRTPTGLYVGSTCNYTNRKYQHKCAIHNENAHSFNYKLYQNIRENNDEWEMKPYSEFPCKNKIEMTIEEERVRRELNADLNSYSCYGRDKEGDCEKLKQYRQANKEKVNAWNKKSYEKNKEKRLQYAKEYREKNIEYVKQKGQEYRDKNHEILKAYFSTIVNCPCGCSVRRSSIDRHKKTKKHLKLMKDKEAINN